jgi:hypothetical protein
MALLCIANYRSFPPSQTTMIRNHKNAKHPLTHSLVPVSCLFIFRLPPRLAPRATFNLLSSPRLLAAISHPKAKAAQQRLYHMR